MAIPGNFLSAVVETVDPDTSGWTAVLNCTKSLGSGGRAGDGVLTITSVASGEMQASTSAAYPVAAGTLYQAFADAASATQPERIGIQWLSATYGVVGSTTWSLTTNTASSSWHRVSVAGAAPVGAVYARVVLSAAATAAARTHFFENIFLGRPQRTSGNLLSFNAESPEVDTSAWVADANCTVTTDAPPVQWPVDYYLAGGEVVKATTTANGNMSIRCAESPTVQPGVDYRGYLYVTPPTTTAACWVELRWYDASATLLSSNRADLANPAGTGWYRQYVSGVAPDTAVTVVLAIGITSATAAQVLRVEGAVIQPASTFPVVLGTVMPYEDASFEQGVGAWMVLSGVATIARTTPWAFESYDGAYALKVTSSTATTSVLASGKYPVVEGVSWRAQLQITVLPAVTWGCAPQIHYYDASDSSLSVSSLPADSIPGDTGTWWFDYNDVAAPAGAVSARIEVSLTAPTTAAVCYLDAVALYQTAPGFEADPVDDLGMVRLIMRELTAGDLLTVYRIVGVTQSVVRGPSGPLQGFVATAQLVVEDYEAPIGVPVWYRYEEYDPTTGAYMGEAATATVTLTVPDPSDVWAKDVLQPQRNTLVRASVAPDWSRPIEQTEYRIRGRRNSVILSDVRGGLTGTLAVWTDTDDDRASLDFALDPGHVLLFQFPPGLGVEDLYAAVGETGPARVVPFGGETRRLWQLPLTEQDAPIGGVGGTAGWTVQDVATTYATCLDMTAAYATAFDLVLDNREA